MLRIEPSIAHTTVRAWGLTAVDAYLAYDDQTMLSFAKAMWDQTSAYQVTDSDAQKGFSIIQNSTIPVICNGRECITAFSISQNLRRC